MEIKYAEKPEKWPDNAREYVLDRVLKATEEFRDNPSYITKERLLSWISDYDLNQRSYLGRYRVTEYEVSIINTLYFYGAMSNINALKAYLYELVGETARLQKNMAYMSEVINEKEGIGIAAYEQGLMLQLKLYYFAYLKFTVEKNKSFSEQLISVVEDSMNLSKTAEEIAEQLSDAKADLDKLKTSVELAADEKTQTDADAVKALIEALGDVTLEKKESVEAARNAYDALSTDAKKLVSNYDVLVQAEKSIQTLEAKKQQEELKNQMDAAAAASVSSAITAIGEVTLDKRGVVEAARAAYNTLTEDQKALVTNYTDLTAAEGRIAELVKEATDKAEADKAEQERQEALKAKAQPVIDAIAAIGEVTLNSEKAITAARSAYEALEAEVKEKVTNLSDLVVAEKNLALLKAEKESQDKDAAAAASVSSAITAIGEVTLDKRGVVAAARAAYDTLSDVQKSLVTNYSDLQAAESRIAALVKEAADKAEADKAEQAKQEALKTKAQPLVDAIAAIGEVTLDSEEAITAARSAYEALEADVKEKVTNLSDLVIAEKDLAALKAAKKAAEDLKAQQEEAKRQQEEAKKAQEEKLKEQEEKLKAEKDKYGFNEKTTLKSAKVKGKKVTLKWNKVKGASGYEIYCKTGKGKWKLVKTLNKGSKASCKLKGKAGKKYTYKVRVFQKVENKVIYGQYSNTKSAKIKK